MKQVLLIAFTCLTLHGSAQWFVGVKLMGISIHTDDNVNGHLYKAALGKKNRLAFHLGLALTGEYMFNNWFSVKLDHAMFRDCAGKFAGMSMFNLRYTQDLRQMGNGSVGLGPFFYYRKSWIPLPGYVDEGYFKESSNKKWQTKFVWYGGEVEYNYPISPELDWSTNVLPGIPVVIAVASGVRMRVE
jgi:hypothetical protein